MVASKLAWVTKKTEGLKAGIGAPERCTLARKKPGMDSDTGLRRMGDGEGMKCNGLFSLGFNFGEIQLVGVVLTIRFLKPCERQLVGPDLTTKF